MYSTYAPTSIIEQGFVQRHKTREQTQDRSSSLSSDSPRTLSLIAALLLFAVLVAQVTVRVAIIRQGYTLEASRQATMENDQRLRQYRLHYAWMTSPQQLTLKAQQELEMTPLRPQQIRKM